MKDASEEILSIFKEQPYAEFSTSELIKKMYPLEYERIKSALHDPHGDKQAKLVAKRHKGQLHRRLLYHLNRLVSQEVIIVQFVKGKGEKHYILNTSSNGNDSSFVQVVPSHQPLSRLEGFVEKKIVKMFDSRSWQARMNAVLLDAHNYASSKSLHEHLIQINPLVNDVIGLVGMEKFLLEEDLSTLSSFLRQLDIDTRDNNKYVSLLIDVTKSPELKYTEDFFSTYARLNPERVQISFVLDKKFVVHHQRFMKKIIRDFSDQCTKINVQNKELHKAPILRGRAGMYTISDAEWKTYLEEVRGKTIGLCFARSSVGVDLRRFFSDKRSGQDFRRLVEKLSRALMECNAVQRRNSSATFKAVNALNKSPREFFRFANNYIRLWNYDWEDEEGLHFVDLLKSVASDLSKFNEVEETIFKSCGMPIRFCARLASLFPKFESKFFSDRRYSKFTITSPASLRKQETLDFLTTRAKIAKIFSHNDRVRFFRATPLEVGDVFEEIRYALETFNLSFITYDFAERKQHLTLDQFIGGSNGD